VIDDGGGRAGAGEVRAAEHVWQIGRADPSFLELLIGSATGLERAGPVGLLLAMFAADDGVKSARRSALESPR
jgi:hypothetical protein